MSYRLARIFDFPNDLTLKKEKGPLGKSAPSPCRTGLTLGL